MSYSVFRGNIKGINEIKKEKKSKKKIHIDKIKWIIRKKCEEQSDQKIQIFQYAWPFLLLTCFEVLQ